VIKNRQQYVRAGAGLRDRTVRWLMQGTHQLMPVAAAACTEPK